MSDGKIEAPTSLAELILATNQALLGEVTGQLRGVSVRLDAGRASGRFIFDSPPAENAAELVEELATEVMAQLGAETSVHFTAEHILRSQHTPLGPDEHWVFLRREPRRVQPRSHDEPELDLDTLTGHTVVEIGLGQNQLIIRLDDDAYVSIESDFEVRSGSRSERFATVDAAAASLTPLLGETILSAWLDANGSLVLVMTGANQLIAIPSLNGYESFLVSSANGILVR